MVKRFIIAVIAVIVAWQILDYVIHMVLLAKTYEATADLWRPMDEMKMGLMRLVVLVASFCFVAVYSCLISPKSMVAGVKYGLLWGIGVGIGMGLGTYSVMPIPGNLAVVWLIGTIVEGVVAGIITAAIVKEAPAEAEPEAV
ncbi:MAG: hypothetical protein QGI83_05505 [Candidatus Latescibacteria bacterium]|jgi:LytS/YehU family sensor histidine kinase|nr:hypothetical protein [Candidatus Latescibacterota bacterium]